VRKAVEGQLSALNAGTLGGKVGATLGTIIDRYMAEDFLTLRHSTQTTNKSLIDLHIRRKWEDVRLADVSAMAVKQWLYKLPFGAASKARARNMLSRLMDLAMLWEYIPVGRNPMELVRVKGSTKRQKEIVTFFDKFLLQHKITWHILQLINRLARYRYLPRQVTDPIWDRDPDLRLSKGCFWMQTQTCMTGIRSLKHPR
jgi:hypothetical protein